MVSNQKTGACFKWATWILMGCWVPFVSPSLQAAEVKAVSPGGPGRNATWIADLESRMLREDHLGARILVKRIATRGHDAREWGLVRNLLLTHPRVGTDLVLAWEKRRPQNGDLGEMSPADKLLLQADGLMVQGQFAEATALYFKVASAMKKRLKVLGALKPEARPAIYQNIVYMYPYVLHHLGRALYSLGRYNESLEVYTWLTPVYARYRQSLFERMWAAFRAGRVDYALGAIASQRSDYFSSFLEPETYVVQIYLYKKLCRVDDLKQVLLEVKNFKDKIANGQYGIQEWARSEIETHDLDVLANGPTGAGDESVSLEARQREQGLIRTRLARAFEKERKRLQETLDLTVAYAQLATSGNTDARLQPVEKLASRAHLFKQNLEIWPADKAEDWIDEVGQHRFLGESLCGEVAAAGSGEDPASLSRVRNGSGASL